MNQEKGFSKIVLIIVVIIIAAFVTAYYKETAIAPVFSPTPTATSGNENLYKIDKFNLEFQIPPGFHSVENYPEESVIFANGEGDNAGTLKIDKISDSSASFGQKLTDSVIFDASGMSPKSINEFSKIKLGNNEFYYIRAGLFEGVLSMDYFLIIPQGIYKFEAISRGVDWTNPNFNPKTDVNVIAVENLLKTVSVINSGF